MSLTTDPAIIAFSRDEPAFLPPGDWWILNLAGPEQLEASLDGGVTDDYDTGPIVATEKRYTHPGGIHVRPVNSVQMYARRARFV